MENDRLRVNPWVMVVVVIMAITIILALISECDISPDFSTSSSYTPPSSSPPPSSYYAMTREEAFFQ